MKRILLSIILAGLTSVAFAAEEEKSKHENWTSDSWDSELAKMPKGSFTNGQHLANSEYCYTCHGEKGITESKKNPSLAGLSNAWLYKTLLDYKFHLFHIDSDSSTMEVLLQPLNKQELSDLAVYYSAQSRPTRAGNVEAPKKLKKCQKCHDTGEEEDKDTPSLIGQSSKYIKRQILAYQNKTRKTEIGNSMYKAVKKLSEKEIDELANYFSKQ